MITPFFIKAIQDKKLNIDTINGSIKLRTSRFKTSDDIEAGIYLALYVSYYLLLKTKRIKNNEIVPEQGDCPPNAQVVGLIFHEDTVPEGLDTDTVYFYPRAVVQLSIEHLLCQIESTEILTITIPDPLLHSYIATLPRTVAESLLSKVS